MSSNEWLDIDILEDYLDGKLDAKTMHQIEKISLEDAFIADALTGLSQSPKRNQTLSLLQKQLQQRVAQKPVVQKRWRITSQRLSIASAAAVLFIAVSVLFWMKESKRQEQMHKQAKNVEVNIAPKVATAKSTKDSVLPFPQIASTAPEKISKSPKPNSSPALTAVASIDKLSRKAAPAQVPMTMASEAVIDTKIDRVTIEAMQNVPLNGAEAYQNYLNTSNKLIKNGFIGKVVELNFKIAANGTPTDIVIVKSAGTLFDNEAIRLVKEGPKWIYDTNKINIGVVTVQF